MASKKDCCKASAATSAGAVVVSTSPAAFYGISVSGSANATVIEVKNGITTAGATVFIVDAPATCASFDGPPVPIICPSGLVTTNIGTVVSYVVLFGTV